MGSTRDGFLCDVAGQSAALSETGHQRGSPAEGTRDVLGGKAGSTKSNSCCDLIGAQDTLLDVEMQAAPARGGTGNERGSWVSFQASSLHDTLDIFADSLESSLQSVLSRMERLVRRLVMKLMQRALGGDGELFPDAALGGTFLTAEVRTEAGIQRW